MNYCESPYHYRRRPTREVMVGGVGIGGANPIRVQSMITCDTMDTEASIAQTIELAEAGCEIVRITAPTVKDAANLAHIVLALIESVRRKPVNMKILEWVQTACATLIIGYMLYISFFDIGDLFGRSSDRKSPVKTPPAQTQSTPSR